MALSSKMFDDFNEYGRTRREMEQMEKLYRMQQQAMAQPGFTQSGTGAVETKLAKPEKPKHLNPKLLLTKGA